MAQVAEKIVLEVEARTETGKNACRRIRASGRVPGNVYGLDSAAFAVAIQPKRVEELLRTEGGRNAVLTLSLDGRESRTVMLRELQRDPVTERLVHIDFIRIDPTKTVQANVEIRLVGLPVGVKTEGGLVDFVHRHVSVSCLPGSIPGHFDVDISELHIGQHVSVADIPLAEGVAFLDPPETIIAVVAAPKAEVEAKVGEEEAAVDEAAAEDKQAPKEGEAAESTGEKES